MSAEAVLTTAMVLWGLVTLAMYVAYRINVGAQNSGWRRLAEERRKQRLAWRMLEACGADRRYPDAMAQLDEYLRDDSPHYVNLGRR